MARASRVFRRVEQFGANWSAPRRGAHYKVKADGYRTFPLTCHNGTKSDIDDRYIRALCRNFDWDYEEFKEGL